MGNGDVPVGSYSVEILKNLGIDLQRLEADGSVTYASNVSEVATQIKEGWWTAELFMPRMPPHIN